MHDRSSRGKQTFEGSHDRATLTLDTVVSSQEPPNKTTILSRFCPRFIVVILSDDQHDLHIRPRFDENPTPFSCLS